MSDHLEPGINSTKTSDRHETRYDLEQIVAGKERRRLRARRTKNRSVWFGLGMFGVIGWSIAVPMVLGIAVGLWVDSQARTVRSWTLMLMVAGLGIGCLNAWTWIRRESVEKNDADKEETMTKGDQTS